MKKTLYVLLALIAVLAWRDWTRREILHPPGVLVPEAPVQAAIQQPESFLMDDYRLTRRAGFEIRARVLSRENYRWGSASELSPMDLALGWKVMSDQSVLDRIDITQGSRWYFTRYEYPAPIPDQSIINNSSNMHMIPASNGVAGRLKKIRRGDIVRIRGFLVDVDHDSGFFWRTSLSRDDTGNGSCEILYVDWIEIEMRN